MKSKQNQEILKQALFSCSIDGLVAITTLKYTFCNPFDDDIEALYHVPLPSHTVLQNLTIVLDGEMYHAEVQKKSDAHAKYEEAIDKNDSPVMLEEIDDGLYLLQCGRLQPGDEIEVELQIAELLRPSGTHARYFLPTVIAPIYGDERQDIWDQHTNSFMVEYPYTMEIEVVGVLQHARVMVPGVNNLSVAPSGDKLSLSFSGFLDKDIYLLFDDVKPFNIRYPLENESWRGVCHIEQRGSFDRKEDFSRDIVAVLDCSGSMYGANIEQAKKALLQIMEELRDSDQFRLLLFGSSQQWLQRKPIFKKSPQFRRLKDRIASVDADLGGTELLGALQEAHSELKGDKENHKTVLLISDENFFDYRENKKSVQKQFVASKTALFAVAVGAAPLVQALDSFCIATDGMTLAINPWEPMPQRIAWLTDRIGMQRRGRTKSKSFAMMPALFDGEYEVRFDEISPDKTDKTDKKQTKLQDGHKDALSSIAMMQYYRSHHGKRGFSAEKAEAFAVEHHLLCKHTALIAVAERNDSSHRVLPQVHPVEQMVPELSFNNSVVQNTMRYEKVCECTLENPSHWNLSFDVAMLERKLREILDDHHIEWDEIVAEWIQSGDRKLLFKAKRLVKLWGGEELLLALSTAMKMSVVSVIRYLFQG
ncbi:VWA domain-containing protein [bacterium]|nr:VWA domain-containing protein [bacterium]